MGENNSYYFTPTSLKKDSFPRESHWTWNRSNGTIVVDVFKKFRISLAKFNSRRTKPNLPQPSYKIWSYSVTVLQTNEEFTFIWCTKGKNRNINSSKSTKISQATIERTTISQPKNSTSLVNTNENAKSTETESGSAPSYSDLILSDFAFLRPFTDPNIANQLGW